MTKPSVIAIAGATGSGKSALAMTLAKRLGGEIICMDSMQIYRRMDIGTAKPTPQERREIPHHMLDIVEPTEAYAVADYAREAEGVIGDVWARGRLPLLVGGTGLYLKTLMHGLSLGGAKSDEKLRQRLNAIADTPNGRETLHTMLEKADPDAARRLHPNDVRRVVRALEIYELTGVPMSKQPREEAQRPFRVLPLALTMPRPALYERLERRVHEMMRVGLLDEVRGLLESGVSPQAQAMQGIGYKELVSVAQGMDSIEEAVRQIILHTRHYAKRQETWLRTEPAVVWLDALSTDTSEEALRMAERFLAENERNGSL